MTRRRSAASTVASRINGRFFMGCPAPLLHGWHPNAVFPLQTKRAANDLAILLRLAEFAQYGLGFGAAQQNPGDRVPIPAVLGQAQRLDAIPKRRRRR